MKKRMMGFLTIILGIVFAGCGTASKEIRVKSQSEKTNVFTEIRDGSAIPKGFADLTITANIKTHSEGYYILESKESLHGNEKYPFLINIDGQAARWEVDGIRDIKPAYDQDGKTSHNPEAREGIKYVLQKSVRLLAGQHRIFFGLPEENYFTLVEISLREGEAGVVEFRPVYRTRRIPSRIPTFLKGIDKHEVFLNGKQIL